MANCYLRSINIVTVIQISLNEQHSAMCLMNTPYIEQLIVVGRFIHSGLNRSHAMQVVAACSGK